MAAIRDEPSVSWAGIATKMGWHNKQHKPDRSKVQRRLKTLEHKKWVERDGDRLELTNKGKDRLAKRITKEAAPESGPV